MTIKLIYAVETYQRKASQKRRVIGAERKKEMKGKKEGREEQFKRDSIKCHLFKDTSFAENEKGRYWKIKQRSEREGENQRLL